MWLSSMTEISDSREEVVETLASGGRGDSGNLSDDTDRTDKGRDGVFASTGIENVSDWRTNRY